MLIAPERLETDETLRQYESNQERFNDSISVTDDKIFLTTIYLEAYKNENNPIPNNMINVIYELLTYIHNEKPFKIKSEECISDPCMIEISLNETN